MWVARSKEGDLYLFTSKPEKCKTYYNNGQTYEYWDLPEYPDEGDKSYESMRINPELFPELTWDSDPIEIILNKKYGQKRIDIQCC